MEAISRILKNTLVFLLIFLAVNYLITTFFGPADQMPNDGNLIFSTTDNEYSRRQIVGLEIDNNTNETITIPNECPGEPFNVFRYENNEWTQKNDNPDIKCEDAVDIVLEPGQSRTLSYENWNYALFSETGRFKVEFETELKGETKTISTNEFLIVKEGMLRRLWDGVFYRPIYNGLIYFASIMPGHNFGFAIILLTLLIRTILLVPSQKAIRSQRKIQEVQPRLDKIKKKYKGDQQRIAAETMAVWKDAQVNPFGSCMPLLLQFPFLIALFYVIQTGLNPDQAHLLYSEYANFTLSDIDVNFLGLLDLTKPNIYVLPLIVGGLQFFQMKLAMARKASKKPKKNDKKKGGNLQDEMQMASNMMVYVMPVMIAVFTASLPAGVGVYWGTSTIYGIGQQLVVNRGGGNSPKSSDEPTVKVIEKKDKKDKKNK
jgi:YidC/Oxa1 family membrane protein insertase